MGSATTSWAVPFRATPRQRCPTGLQTGREPHQHLVGSREESPPPDTWTESGQTPALREVSSSREAVDGLWALCRICRGPETPKGPLVDPTNRQWTLALTVVVLSRRLRPRGHEPIACSWSRPLMAAVCPAGRRSTAERRSDRNVAASRSRSLEALGRLRADLLPRLFGMMTRSDLARRYRTRSGRKAQAPSGPTTQRRPATRREYDSRRHPPLPRAQVSRVSFNAQARALAIKVHEVDLMLGWTPSINWWRGTRSM